jgi:hypothetical protein
VEATVFGERAIDGIVLGGAGGKEAVDPAPRRLAWCALCAGGVA